MYSRKDAYLAIDGERRYQQEKWGRDHDNGETVANFLIYIRRYLNKAEDALTDNSGQFACLDVIRKISALGVAAMEQFGVVRREGF